MTLLRTPLYDWHAAHQGRIVEFGGWEMPVQYTGIVDEHHAVRKAAGLFDISHMGRLSFSGLDVEPFLSRLVTCRVDNLADGQIRYGLVCGQNGGVLDDILVYKLDPLHFGLVVNASNRAKIVAWIEQHEAGIESADHAVDFEFLDQTTESAMIAIQGPKALMILSKLARSAVDLGSLRYYSGCPSEVAGVEAYISRTGYTGEDGFEIVISESPAAAVKVWEQLLEAGQGDGLLPCGLGCRDTLRLEAAMPLYGHELNENVDPLTAGLAFAVKLDKPDFIGRDALVKIKAEPNRPVRVGLKLASRRIARENAELYSGDVRIGQVTSGTFSPTLEQSIAMGYVDASHAATGTAVEVDIRGKREAATVVALPFYKRAQ
ncbi:MAG: glycine cleavage system aminomethyltransferase GcvT [Planctomycetes bacterium]|nr:glycine cleavage system aminomethyltransferase GcvT [Planctomycetota bacterium]